MLLLAGLNAETARRRPPAKPADLSAMIRDLRQAPSAGKRADLEAYAAKHTKDTQGPLAWLGLGVASYEQKDYATAISDLKRVQGRLPQIADYAAYYFAASRVEAQDFEGVEKDIAPAHAGEVLSPLAGKAYLVEARALQGARSADAIELLRGRYAELPQPEGDVALADAYQAAKDLPHAAEFYQRVYYEYLTGEPAARAAAALLALKDTMSAAYPEPLPQQLLRRAGRLMEARDYPHAAEAYREAQEKLVGLERDQARVRAGAADLLGGSLSASLAYLRSLDLPESEADAERYYYLLEGARRANDDSGLQSALEKLNKRYEKSPWRLRGLATAGSRFLLVNRPDDYLPLYRAAYGDFPDDPAAGLYHWKVTFQAYLRGDSKAAGLLREHLERYPSHPTAGAAMYFSGRLAEQKKDPATARACYERLAQALPNTYYAMLARDRLRALELPGSAGTAPSFIAEWKPAAAAPVPAESTRPTALRIERSRLLRAAGLSDLSESELRFGARTDGQPTLLAMEAGGSADTPHRGLRLMKAMAGDYLSLKMEDAPRRFWELLYPLPYRADLERFARERGLDPFLVAGLIRQESEFNPEAVSHANAYGLAQVRPGTGRDFARRAGVARFTPRSLFQPAVNLRIGTLILRSMLDRQGGRLEPTLAAYNAGPQRAAEWLAWKDYREPAEFVESIPYTETRDYVQAVLRNADMYRRLYR